MKKKKKKLLWEENERRGKASVIWLWMDQLLDERQWLKLANENEKENIIINEGIVLMINDSYCIQNTMWKDNVANYSDNVLLLKIATILVPINEKPDNIPMTNIEWYCACSIILKRRKPVLLNGLIVQTLLLSNEMRRLTKKKAMMKRNEWWPILIDQLLLKAMEASYWQKIQCSEKEVVNGDYSPNIYVDNTKASDYWKRESKW